MLGTRNYYQHTIGRLGSLALANTSDPGAAGSGGGLHRAFVRGHESLCDSCEESHDHAEGYSVGAADTRGLGWAGLIYEHDSGCWWSFGSRTPTGGLEGLLVRSIGVMALDETVMGAFLRMPEGLSGGPRLAFPSALTREAMMETACVLAPRSRCSTTLLRLHVTLGCGIWCVLMQLTLMLQHAPMEGMKRAL